MSSTITLLSGNIISYTYHLDAPTAPTLVLASPLAAPSTIWDPIVDLLKNSFSILRYNQPGHGASSARNPDSTTFDEIADNVKGLLDALEIKKVHAWIGVSMGAATGVVFAGRYPGVINRLVICDTVEAAPGNLGEENVFGARVETARREGSLKGMVVETMERWFGKEWMAENAEEAGRIRAAMETTSVEGFAACCAALSSGSFDLRPVYPKLAESVESVLCVVGEKDGPLPEIMEGMRGKIEEGFAGKKNVELKVVPGAGHVSFVDGKEEWLKTVDKFIRT